jgi:Nif-specific regulatory protein
MDARLVAISGPLEGAVFRLTGESTIGRDKGNAVAIEDRALSRRHCVIWAVDNQFQIRDLESSNGTYVNGLPVAARALKDGDQIKAGQSFFVFSVCPALTEPTLTGASPTIGTVLQPEDAVYLLPDRLPRDHKTLKDLEVLYKLGAAMAPLRTFEQLQQQLLKMTLAAIPADRGALLLSGPQLASAVFARVMREGVGLLGNTVLAAPLRASGKNIGVLYLVAPKPGMDFNEDHLQLLMGIGRIAGAAIENVQAMESLLETNRRLEARANVDRDLVGRSPAMLNVFEFARKVAVSESTVLIRGEGGTGKELLARAIHGNSARAGKPFVAIHCNSLGQGEALMVLDQAAGGSVFFDELGDMPALLQERLLQVIVEKQFGGVRVMAATNRDLETAVRNGVLRRDLYYRLNLISVVMPPLRERQEDIFPLANHLVRKHAARAARPVTGVSEAARGYLMTYDWPGNLRELENAMERAVAVGSTDLVQIEDLPERVLEVEVPGVANAGSFSELVREAKKQILLRTLQATAGDYGEAAQRLQMPESQLQQLVRRLKLR